MPGLALLAFLTFTTPLLLAGLALLSLPLVAHWLHRRSRRTIVFPSIALLVQSAAQQSQFHRLKRWILLALRLLAVACIVLAFTRPVWQSSDAGAAIARDAAAAVVLVVDVSASTGQQQSGVTELAALKTAAGRILDDLQPGRDVAGIVLADASPRPVFPRLSANIAGLRAELSRLRATQERSDFPGALAAAGKLLASHDGPRRLFIISDLQRSNWSDLAAGGPGDALPRETVVTLLPGERPAADNIALSRPRCFPPVPLAGAPFDVSVHVSNYSDRAAQVRIACERMAGDGGGAILGRDESTITLAPREEQDVTFRVPALETQRQFIKLEAAPGDGLPLDDIAWLIVETTARTPAIVLSDDDPDEPGSTAFYLMRALAPSEEESTRFQPRRLRPMQLSTAELGRARVVVAGYLGALTVEQSKLLSEFVRDGGALVWFSGEGPVDRNLQSLERAADGDLLPWSPGPRRAPTDRREPRRLGSGRWQSRWLRGFDEQSQLALQEIPFEKTWTSGAIAPAAEVLLSFDDGGAALGVRTFGRGTMVVANFSPESTTSDLARHGAFVAFLQMTAQAALPAGEGERPLVVGEPWVWDGRYSPDEVARLRVVGPHDQPEPLSSRREQDQMILSIGRTSQAGLYQLMRDGDVLDVIATNLDERESNLERLPAAELEASMSATGANVRSSSPGSGEPLTLRGRPLWGAFLSAAMVAIGLELLLLGWWRR